MKNSPTVYCVIPVHNRLNLTKQCIEYLEAQDYDSLQIVIVNDGSVDGTGEYLEHCKLTNLTVLTGDGELWWGGAMHMGIAHVIKTAMDTDYLLMLNDDVRIEPDFVSTLIKESIVHGNSIVGPCQRDDINGVQLGSGYLIDYYRMRINALNISSEYLHVDALPARGALFPMKAVMRTGNIRKGIFPHYLGDLEYSARIREAGWKVIASGKVSIYTSLESSDKQIRNQGLLKDMFSFRSKNNTFIRLWFFCLRGPLLLRLWAVPRYVIFGIWRVFGRVNG